MTPPATPRLSVGSPTQLAALIPHLLGFTPSESLVVVAASGPRRRLGLTLRIDLPAPQDDAVVAVQLVDRLLASGADELLVAVFTDRPSRAGLPRADLVAEITACGVPVVEAVLVGGGRCRSFLCDDASCCPPEGRPVSGTPEADRIAAEFLAVGSRVLTSRAELVDSVLPVTGEDAVAARAAVADGRDWTAAVGGAAAVRWLDDWLGTDVGGCADPRCRPDPQAIGRMIVLLDRIPVRDAVLARWVAEVIGDRTRADAWWRLLTEMVRVSLPPDDAPACTLYAIAAYQGGDGVLADVALQRARSSRPDYVLARLIGDALAAQLPPRRLLEALQDATSPR